MNTALGTPQYTKLRDYRYTGKQLVKLFSNRTVFAGQTTTDLSLSTNWASFNYGSVSVGAYTDVVVDQVLVIYGTNDKTKAAQTWYGRIRKAPTSGIIYCNESSANFSVGAYWFVLDTFYPQFRLSRPSTNDPATAIELVDYDLAFQQMLPAIVGLPTAIGGYVWTSGNKFRYAFDLSQSFAATSGATVSSYLSSFPSATLAAGSLSTAYFVLDFSAGEQWGLVSVTDSGSRVLYRHVGVQVLDDSTNAPDTGFDGAELQWGIDQGGTLTLPAFTGVDSVLNNTLALVIRTDEQYGDTAGRLWGGSTATVTNKALTSNIATITATNTFAVGQQVVVVIGDSAFDGTYTILSASGSDFTYQKTHANVASASASGLAVVNPNNIDFIGWLQREDDPVLSDATHGIISTARITFIDVAQRMQKMVSELLPIMSNSSPTLWGLIVNLTPWRAFLHYLTRYTTIGNLCDLVVDDTTTAYAFPVIPTVSGNVLSNLNTLANQINAWLVFDPRGPIGMLRSAEYLTAFQRGSLVNVANWDRQDAFSLTRGYEPNPNTGRVDGDAAFFNTFNSQVAAYTARAPGIAQGEAPGSQTLSTQILVSTSVASAALDDLLARVGTKLLIENNNETLEVEHPDGYMALPFICSRSQLFTWTLDATLGGTNGVNRIVYTTATSWWVESVSSSYNQARGSRTCKVKYRRLVPVADPGDNTTQVPPGQVETPPFSLPAFNFDLPELTIPDAGLTIPELPPAALLPPPGKIATFTGQELLIWDDDQVAVLRNFINLTTPQATDITPGTLLGTFRQGVIDPYFTNTLIPAYLLESDGSNSLVSWNPNIATPGSGSAWQDGGSLTDEFKVMRATMTQGAIMIYTPDAAGGGFTQNINFLTTSGGFVAEAVFVGISGTWTSGIGWQATSVRPTSTTYGNTLDIDLDLGALTTITGGTLTYDLTKASITDSGLNNGFALYDGGIGGTLITSTYVQSSTDADGTGKTLSFAAGSYVADTVHIQLRSAYDTSPVSPLGSAIVTALTFTGTTSAGVQVAVSFTFGGSFLTPLAVGSTPGSTGGFDVQRSGANSFAAIDDAVARATTLGGAYSSWYSITGGTAQAACIIVPYFNWAGALQTSVANPDIIVALTANDGSSRTLLWIEGGATPGTVHDITPVAGITFDSPNCVTVLTNSRIAVFGLASGVYKLYTSTNKGTSWTNRGTLATPYFIRDRRNDGRASPNGQLFLASNSELAYSSKWASGGGSIAGMWPRIPPFTSPKGLDTIW